MKSYANQCAFITGGGSGIGRALAKALSARGAKVCVADINHAAALKSCIESFAGEHGRLFPALVEAVSRRAVADERKTRA